MKLKIAAMAFGLVMSGQMALALTPDEVIADMRSAGYTRVEVRVGPTQIKVEAIRGTEKLEVIYDKETGRVLKTETEAVEADDNTAPGVSVRERGSDFVRVVTRSPSDDDTPGNDDRDDDRDDDNGSDDDSNDDNGGDRDDDNGSDDDGNDDGNDDNGGERNDDDGDDDHGDDHGDDHDSNDDNGGDSNDDDGDDD